jgi:DNA-binding NarL/FixJ family response regulator
VVGQLILGGHCFIESLHLQIMDKSESKEFSRQQHVIGRPNLAELFIAKHDKRLRTQTIKIADLDYGYSLKEIANHIGRHYSTISLIVSS